MRNQKEEANPLKNANPLNKLRKEEPQLQPGVKPKQPGKQFNVDKGKAALKGMFAQFRRKGA